MTPGFELWPHSNEAGLMHLESSSLPSFLPPKVLIQLLCTDMGHVSVSAPQAVDSSHAAYRLSSALSQEGFQHSWERDSSCCSPQGKPTEQRHGTSLQMHVAHSSIVQTNCTWCYKSRTQWYKWHQVSQRCENHTFNIYYYNHISVLDIVRQDNEITYKMLSDHHTINQLRFFFVGLGVFSVTCVTI